MQEFAVQRIALGHDVRRLQLYDGAELHTTIYSDFTLRELLVENHVSDPGKTAFGENESPSWEDFRAFAMRRCLPCLEEDLKTYLASLGMDDERPLVVVQKEPERVNSDLEWIKLEVLKGPPEQRG